MRGVGGRVRVGMLLLLGRWLWIRCEYFACDFFLLSFRSLFTFYFLNKLPLLGFDFWEAKV